MSSTTRKISKRKNKDSEKKITLSLWNHEEKQKFVSALCKGPPYRHDNGKINWIQLKRFIGTKSLKDVKNFAKKFHSMEHGNAYKEFSLKAAIDVWRQLAETTTDEEDKIADICIPQVFTVTALEPINIKSNEESSSAADGSVPSYKNIYNYLSSISRGTDVAQLNIAEASIVLSLLEDLILTLSKSQTLIQREYLHSSYKELRKYLDLPGVEKLEKEEIFSSMNPFGIPSEILNFQLLDQCSNKNDKAGRSGNSSLDET